MEQFTFDVGTNLTSLGFAFLFLRYVFPVVIVALVALAVFWMYQDIFGPLLKKLEGKKKETILGALLIFFLLALFLIR